MDFIYEQNRIYSLDQEGRLMAEVTFPQVRDHVVNIDHTFVDPSLRGQGIAAQLLDAAYNEIKKQNKTAMATCSYAVKWFEEDMARKDIMAK